MIGFIRNGGIVVGADHFQAVLDISAGFSDIHGLEMARRDNPLPQLLHRHDLYEIAEVNPECRSHLEAIYDCFLDIFERAIVKGQTDGSIGEMTPRKVALLLFAMVDGLVRLNTYNLYDGGALYRELMELCRKMLESTAHTERLPSC